MKNEMLEQNGLNSQYTYMERHRQAQVMLFLLDGTQTPSE